MTDYAIGDVQGCYDPLMRLLDSVDFNEHRDTLWFAGDLVNRGPQSLMVLRFIQSLPNPAKITLGNHDLHLLKCLFTITPADNQDDTLDAFLKAPDAEVLGHWLRKQSILIHAPELNLVMSHAGIAPLWDLTKAKALALELEQILSDDEHYKPFLKQMYGNEPALWTDTLTGMDRLRTICNYFTRMRLCDAKGRLYLNFKGPPESAPASFYPWYQCPTRNTLPVDIVFGHWAALMGQCPVPGIHAIDTGCLWGGTLTALRLQDKRRFSVPGLPA